jgi:membrane associated rhomboid family serine protease
MIPLRDAQPSRRRPIVTLGLVVSCLAVFSWELWLGAADGGAALDELLRAFGVIPAELVAAAAGETTPGPPEVATLGTHLFLHAGWFHLAGNLLYLWIFGNNVEDRLGPLPFIGFYLASGVAAALVQVAIDPGVTIPLVGASGAISGILGAYLVLFPRARVLSLVFLGFFYQLLEVPAVLLLGIWFVLQLLDGILSLGADATAGGVAVFAHLGGFVVGAGLGLALRGATGLRSAGG